MSNTQSKPTVLINGQVFPIKPNSLSVTLGLGEYKVLVESYGGSQVQEVIGEDLTNQIGKIEFKMYNTGNNILLAKELKLRGSSNTAQFTTSNGLGGSMSNAVMTNDVKADYSPDGEIDITIEGSQIDIG